MLLFISGWPSCGATHYGEWLADHRNFRHLDLDAEDNGHSTWRERCDKLTTGLAPKFAKELLREHPRWVITRRIPTNDVALLEALKAGGFSLWFLLPRTEGLSRSTWLAREREINPQARPADWEKMASAIRSSARGLRPFFRDHCVETLVGGGELIDAATLAERLGVAPAE